MFSSIGRMLIAIALAIVVGTEFKSLALALIAFLLCLSIEKFVDAVDSIAAYYEWKGS